MAAVKPHILFVDDEPPVREMLALYFRKKNFDVTTAVTIKEAIESLDKNPYDAAILDINLAGENGLELLGIIRKKHEKLPVIMFTAMGDDQELLDQAMAAGASGFMCKTQALDALFNEVCRHLPKRTAA